MAPEPDRRSFLSFATFGIGAIFSAVLGIPLGAYFLDPRHRKGPKSDLKLVSDVTLADLVVGTPPMQGVIRDTRTDGWTLYPNDVLGRVWVVQLGVRPNLTTPAKVEEFNASAMPAKEAYVIVFTTICPHLGCSVNLDGAGTGFACPCHAATFVLNGARAAASNPALRGMDTLEWEIDPEDPDANRIKVKYQNFKSLQVAKEPMS
ncbi:MAG: hypothetical protein EXR98_07585 [Gemmataceae bacterium]|nr:hypothetical protein [Gemmataceae bacterium]